MGEVYRARHEARSRRRDQDSSGRVCGNCDRVARVEREAKLLASLNHPQIAALRRADIAVRYGAFDVEHDSRQAG
jgi:serine/threonine protein kinase